MIEFGRNILPQLSVQCTLVVVDDIFVCLMSDRASLMICREKVLLDAAQWFTELVICSACFGHYYAHHQELETIHVITVCGTLTLCLKLVVWFGVGLWAMRPG